MRQDARYVCAVSRRTPSGPHAYRYNRVHLRLPDSVLGPDTTTRIVRYTYMASGDGGIAGKANCRIPNTAAARSYLQAVLAPTQSRQHPPAASRAATGTAALSRQPGGLGSWDAGGVHPMDYTVCDSSGCTVWGEPIDFCDVHPEWCSPPGGGYDPPWSSDPGDPGNPGDPYDPCTADNFVPGVPEIPASEFPPDDNPNSTFDCKQTLCPSAETIANSPEVVQAEKGLADKSAGSATEYGAWIFKMPDGSIQIGIVDAGGVVGLRQYYAGTNDPKLCGSGYSCVPQLSSQPQVQANSGIYIIGSIHSHPPTTGQWPTGDDFKLATHNDAYVLVAMQESTIVIDRNGNPVAQCPRPVYGSCRGP